MNHSAASRECAACRSIEYSGDQIQDRANARTPGIDEPRPVKAAR